jgi:hypothetical protein
VRQGQLTLCQFDYWGLGQSPNKFFFENYMLIHQNIKQISYRSQSACLAVERTDNLPYPQTRTVVERENISKKKFFSKINIS